MRKLHLMCVLSRVPPDTEGRQELLICPAALCQWVRELFWFLLWIFIYNQCANMCSPALCDWLLSAFFGILISFLANMSSVQYFSLNWCVFKIKVKKRGHKNINEETPQPNRPNRFTALGEQLLLNLNSHEASVVRGTVNQHSTQTSSLLSLSHTQTRVHQHHMYCVGTHCKVITNKSFFWPAGTALGVCGDRMTSWSTSKTFVGWVVYTGCIRDK